MTGGGYFYGFSFVDKIVKAGNTNTSHHLLTCFEFASKAELDEFYGKIWNSFGTTGGIKQSFTVARNYENQIVAPAPDPGKQMKRRTLPVAVRRTSTTALCGLITGCAASWSMVMIPAGFVQL